MVGGIAGDKFVEQGGREVGVEASHETGSGTNKVCAHIGVAGAVAPQRRGIDGAPRIVNVAEGEAIVVGEVVVNADEFLAPVGRFGNSVEVRRVAAGRAVGGGNQREKRSSVGVDGDSVVREGHAPRANLRRTIRECGQVDGGDCGISRAEIVKVSGAFGIRRNILVVGVGNFLAAPLLRPEEEGLFLIGVVEVWNENRAPDGVTPIVLFVGSLGFVVETLRPIAGVEDFVAAVVGSAAMEGAAARLGFDFDGAGTVLAILGAVIGGEDLKFSDRFEVGINVERAVGAVIHVVAAIDFPLLYSVRPPLKL